MDRHLAFAKRAAIVAITLCTAWAPLGRSARADAPATRTVVLHPMRVARLRINFDYQFARVLPPFENEPALAGKKTARLLIPTVPPTPALRNITDNELYLKADHNQDFSVGSSVLYKSCYNGRQLLKFLLVFLILFTAGAGAILLNEPIVANSTCMARGVWGLPVSVPGRPCDPPDCVATARRPSPTRMERGDIAAARSSPAHGFCHCRGDPEPLHPVAEHVRSLSYGHYIVPSDPGTLFRALLVPAAGFAGPVAPSAIGPVLRLQRTG